MLETIRNFFWKDETANHRNQRTQSFWNKSEMRKLIWLLFEFAISKQHNFGHPLNFSKRRDWMYHVPAITKLVALELLLLTSSCLVRLQKNQIWAKCIQIKLRNNRNRHLKSWSGNDFGLKSPLTRVYLVLTKLSVLSVAGCIPQSRKLSVAGCIPHSRKKKGDSGRRDFFIFFKILFFFTKIRSVSIWAHSYFPDDFK